MQQKNLVIFLVLMMVVMLGWQQLTHYLYPPKKKPAKPGVAAEKVEVPGDLWDWKALSPADQARLAARIALVPSLPGLDTIGTFTGPLSSGNLEPLVVVVDKKPEPPPPPAIEMKPAVQVTLGAPGSHLQALLTTTGGGVSRVTLNHFQEADKYGLPVWEKDAKKVPVPLDLVPTDLTNPSNRLFHYAQADKDEHPIDSLGQENWELVEPKAPKAGDTFDRAVFRTRVPGRPLEITKTYRLQPGWYHLELEVAIKNLRPAKEEFRYQLEGAHGLPIEGVWYTSTYRNAVIGWTDRRGTVWRHMEEPTGMTFREGGNSVPAGSGGDPNVLLGYAGVTVQYFASVIALNDQQEDGLKDPHFIQRARATLEPGPLNKEKPFLNDITVRMVTKPIELPPDGEVVHKYVLYNGPVKVRLLGHLTGEQAVEPSLVDWYESKLHLNTLTDYHSQIGAEWMGKVASTIGWTQVIIFFTNLMHGLLWFLYKIIGSYGLCIICLTVLVRSLMFPISRKQALTSIKMQSLAPEMKKIQEKHKDDPQERTRAQWDLWKKHKVNPMGGCLPLVLQMPIFLGLYYALQESIHFRLAPFLWIQNLAAPDMLIKWGEKIPWISVPADQGGFLYLGPFFNILPIVAVALMIVQQKLMTPPAMDEQQELQQKMMSYMMIFFGLMFYKVAAGLCIYFIASSIWGVTERKLLPKAKPPGTLAASSVASPAPNHQKNGPPRTKAKSAEQNPSAYGTKLKHWWEDVLREAKKR